jgi:hypothetical protein
MAVGFPTKANWAAGDVLTASAQDDLAGTVNLLNPLAKGGLVAGSGTNTTGVLAVGSNYYVLSAQSGQTTGLQWTGAVTSYTPTWTADSGTPAIGNGTISGYWQRYGNLCAVRFYLQIGSTTTKATGGWYFSLPFTSAYAGAQGVAGSGYIEDYAVQGYRRLVGLTGGTRFYFVNASDNQNAGATNPFTFGTSDYITGEFIYEVAA